MKREPVLVSACLLGFPCRYDGTSKNFRDLKSEISFFIPLCPEQLAGFSTPREPAERKENGRIIRLYSGEDVTNAFQKGAQVVADYCLKAGIMRALLKSKSPSCGEGGATALLLEKHGVKIEYID
jgi:uncharacterized protein YbbK (DUF523 family)